VFPDSEVDCCLGRSILRNMRPNLLIDIYLSRLFTFPQFCKKRYRGCCRLWQYVAKFIPCTWTYINFQASTASPSVSTMARNTTTTGVTPQIPAGSTPMENHGLWPILWIITSDIGWYGKVYLKNQMLWWLNLQTYTNFL
jgi:hypothetical protein